MSEEVSELKRAIEAVDKELERLDAEEEKQKSRQLTVDEEIDVKSRILDRPLMEEKDDEEEEKKEKDFVRPYILEPTTRGASTMMMAPQVAGEGSTGVTPRKYMSTLASTSIMGIVKEAMAIRYDTSLKLSGERHGIDVKNIYSRMWAMTRIEETRRERMFADLKMIEGRTPERVQKINQLNEARLTGTMDAKQRQELKKLEDEEISRYTIRQMMINDVPIQEQEKLNWLRPVGEGAYGVMPYTYISNYDLLSPSQRKGVRWLYDNILLRYQNALAGKFLPKNVKSKSFKEKKKKDLETLFDDMDEEIYSDKKFAEMVKKGIAKLDKMEEELRGYDRITVGEEKKINQMLADYMKKQVSLSKEAEEYS